MNVTHGTPTSPSHYKLVCYRCDRVYKDDGTILRCSEAHGPAFLRTVYDSKSFIGTGAVPGMSRYHAWLPVDGDLSDDAPRPFVYRAKSLAGELGMTDLWIAFSGYWPERGVYFRTCTFKELEVHTLEGRMRRVTHPVVLSSAGNTAAAAAMIFSEMGRPAVIVVPESGFEKLGLAGGLSGCVNIVCIKGGSYADATAFAKVLCRRHGWIPTGGVWNVAMRDGLAAVMLAAYEEMGRLPDAYVQAIGSGAGAIGVWEACKRLSVRGHQMPILVLCQNAELSPVLASMNFGSAPQEKQVGNGTPARRWFADELVNMNPPLAVSGGLTDVLTESRGKLLTASAEEARQAMALFSATEGIDIDPAPAIALACLRKAVRNGTVDYDARVLLNVTGGGRCRRTAERGVASPTRFQTVEPGRDPIQAADHVGKKAACGSLD
jgi:cysteate synthase